MIKLYFFVFVMVFSFILKAQTTVVLSASADNTIYQNFPSNSNAIGQNFFSGNNGGNSPRRALIKFNIASVVPNGAVITSVTLTLNCNISRTIADNISLHKLNTDWGEGTSNASASGDGGGAVATTNDATWPTNFFPASNWTTAGGDFSATASASTSIPSTGFFTWSAAGMIADVQNWLNSPSTNFGWILLCNETTAATARRFASRENATVANRPSLSITYATVVPITLSYFVATKKNNAVQLNWQTEQEINNHYFEVLHSPDGIIFSPVEKVFAAGNSNTTKQYQFIHNANLKGYQYYQLVQTDFNGTKTVSATIKIKIDEEKFSLKLFPNPTTNAIFIKANTNLAKTNYTIHNQHGSIIKKGNCDLPQIDLHNLAKGVYYFYLYKENEIIWKESFCIL